MFIGRANEISKLNELYASNKFECVIIYGRRRVGKTTLIEEFCKGKKSIYFVGIESTIQNNLENLSKSIFSLTTPNLSQYPYFDRFDKALDYIYEKFSGEQIILILDEYPYLASSDKSVYSILQNYIDHKFKNSQLFLILCGSSMNFMENQVLGYKSPLYGRGTAQFKIKPFDYFDSSKFYNSFSHEDNAIIYGITGGIPQYLELFDDKKSLKENIINNVLDKTAYLFEEPGNLLKQELREPHIYNGIIRAIAKGASKLNEIATSAGLETSVCSVYIKSLIALNIVKKENPVIDGKIRKSIYRIEDNLYNFWYRFISENISSIVIGNTKTLYDNAIAPYISDYMGNIFEKMCREYLMRLNYSNLLPFPFLSLGRWWGTDPKNKRQIEIDIVAVSKSEKKAIFAECKYKNELVGMKVLEYLVEKSETIGYRFLNKYYYLFSKSGFTKTLKLYALENTKVKLINLDMLYNLELSH